LFAIPEGGVEDEDSVIFHNLRRRCHAARFVDFVRGAAGGFRKRKTPPPVGQWGSEIRVIALEPNCRAAQSQHLTKQQSDVPVARHGWNS
jgi:hypothetical protein